MPTLIACSHGTNSAAGQEAISALCEQVRELLPEVQVVETYVDVQEPQLPEVVNQLVDDSEVVIVPILLSTGYHTQVDIARVVAAHPERACVTPPLGPHDLLADVLESRVLASGFRAGDALVLAAAGSTDPRASDDVEAVASLLSQRLDSPIHIGYAAGAGTRIEEAVATARGDGAARVVVASYVLAPGYFADVIARGGGDLVTAPLAPDERIARLIVERFRAATSEP